MTAPERGAWPQWCRERRGRRQSSGAWGAPRGRLVPSLLPGLGASGPWVVRATARGFTPASGHPWGMRIEAIPVGGGHRLGWPGERRAAPGSRALGLLLEGDAKKPPCYV